MRWCLKHQALRVALGRMQSAKAGTLVSSELLCDSRNLHQSLPSCSVPFDDRSSANESAANVRTAQSRCSRLHDVESGRGCPSILSAPAATPCCYPLPCLICIHPRHFNLHRYSRDARNPIVYIMAWLYRVSLRSFLTTPRVSFPSSVSVGVLHSPELVSLSAPSS